MTATVQTGCYIFGIVPAGAPVPDADETGPAAGLQLVASAELAALVGRVPPDRPLGRAADLRAHDRVLSDLVRAGTPVLPMRFGAVVADEDAVVHELLEPHRAEFAEALEVVRGRVQYTVKVRYDQDAVLREVVAGSPDIRRLHGRTDHAGQMRLGELVVRALERRRPEEASAVLTELIGAADVRVHDVSSPEEILDAAFLVDADHAAEFERRVEKSAAARHERLRMQLIGPSAPYDFAGGA
jgi:hypothetical protein